MNVELLKYMNEKVRLTGDITHQEYEVFGIWWETDKLMLMTDNGRLDVHCSKVESVPKETDDEEGWYPA